MADTSLVQESYSDLWRKKLADDAWVQNDGKGRVEYAVDLLRPALREGERVLDIGCGRGTLGIWLGRRDGIVGVDIAPEAVVKAREVYETAEVVDVDREPLPFPDDSFDYVVFLDVIEHVFDPRVILREIHRVLKPGGRLILSTPNILAWADELVKTRRFPKTSGDPEPYDGGHLHFFTYQDLYDLLKLAGFASSGPISPGRDHPDYEFKDTLAWVLGEKAKAPAAADPEPRGKTVNVSTRKPFTVPVAVVAFNRPRHTAQVLAALKDYGLSQLYLFVDGAREASDADAVGAVRDLARSVDWAPVEVIERRENIGLARSIVSAATHVFERHETMLLLEDDIVPFPSMFPYMEQAIAAYRDFPQVNGISAYGVPQPPEAAANYPYDAYFFPRISSWGWATWRREWQQFNPDLGALVRQVQASGLDLSLGGSDLPVNLDLALKGRDIWTMNWVLGALLRNGVTLYPVHSQAENIGHDGTGVHSGKSSKFDVAYTGRGVQRLPEDVFVDAGMAHTFYSFYDLPGTPRNLDVSHLGPHELRREYGGNGANPAPVAEAVPRDLLREAMELIRQGGFSPALEKVERARSLGGNIRGQELLRALCFRGLQRLDEARDAVEKELLAFPDNEDAKLLQTALNGRQNAIR